MSITQLKIKEMFDTLSKEEQAELLKILSSTAVTSTSIAEFSEAHQKRYGSNVEFTISKKGPDHAPIVTATAITAFGNFTGEGGNQKIAKANAVEAAENFGKITWAHRRYKAEEE